MKSLFAKPIAVFNSIIYELGIFADIIWQTFKWLPRRPYYVNNILAQCEEVGVRSLPVVIITTMFTGAVLALQSYSAFKRFNAESLIGAVVALSLCRELSPVLTGLIVAGRAGSAMAAAIGTMRVTEQVDALYTLATNPVKYLIVPRTIAGTIMLPMLTGIGNFVGIQGGRFVSVNLLGVNATVYDLATYTLSLIHI